MTGKITDNLGRSSGLVKAVDTADISWQSVVTASTLTAVAGRGYPINTTSNACTVTLPGSASVGDQIIFTDYARNWGTNANTINQNSLNYQGGTATNPVYDTNNESVHIVYMDATQGWIPIYDGAVAYETLPFNGTVDYLVIAGGGGGGGSTTASSYGGAGGGAGGYRASYNSEASGGGGSSETAETHTTGVTYTITVGAGGTGTAVGADNPDDAEDSSFIGTGISITSAGGGGGASRGGSHHNGYNGGSGGGAGEPGNAGSGTSNQGYAGGEEGGNRGMPGGGGAGAVGADSSGTVGGAGGVGVASTISGSSVTRAAGGGGSGDTIGAGGTGGGGAGGKCNVAAVVGTANTGSGGGGAGQADTCSNIIAGAGGAGVVIVRMKDTDYSSSTGSPTVATGQGSGSDETILTFTGDGTYVTVG